MAKLKNSPIKDDTARGFHSNAEAKKRMEALAKKQADKEEELKYSKTMAGMLFGKRK